MQHQAEYTLTLGEVINAASDVIHKKIDEQGQSVPKEMIRKQLTDQLTHPDGMLFTHQLTLTHQFEHPIT